MASFGFRRRNHEPPGGGGGGVTPGTASPAGPPGSETTGIETLAVLRRFEKMHRLDSNLPVEELRDVDAVLASGGNAEKAVEVEHVLVEDNSPYLEVSGLWYFLRSTRRAHRWMLRGTPW